MVNEKRLIDANALAEQVDNLCADWNENWIGNDNQSFILHSDVSDLISDAPTVVAIPVTADELKHLMNDTIAYIWRLEDRKCDRPEFGYDSRKELLEKLKKFYNDHFSEMDGAVNA